jgi:RNAse (barnase) inhibitor barstar
MKYDYTIDYDKYQGQQNHHVSLLHEVEGVEEEAGENILSHKLLDSSAELIQSPLGIKLVEVDTKK